MTSKTEVPDDLQRAQHAVEQGDWDEALRLVDGQATGTHGPTSLRLRGLAEYGRGNLEAAVTAFEACYAAQLERDDDAGAAAAAGTVAMYLMMDTGLMAPVRAWLARGRRLIGEPPVDDVAADDDATHALLAMVRTYERFLSGDPDGTRTAAADAVRLGTRGDFPPAVALGRVATARLAILDGDVTDGLSMLDDVAATLVAGALDPLTTGMVWCELVCAVRGLALHDRAERWTAAMERWRAGNAFGGITGRCRVHRAEVLRWRGPCAEAEDQAVLACEELSPWLRRELGWPLTELGTIRLRRGDLAGAEEAFLAAHERAWDPQPGLALLRLAQGRREAALAMITTALTHPARVPFKERPPFGALSRAPLLAAQAEIAAASGDVTTVTASATALADVAATYESTALQASALVARGRLGLLTGELDDAADALRDAAIAWGEVGAPHETAVARVLLGDVHAARGEDTRARMSWGPARATFGQLGAALWRDRVEERLSAAAEHADVVHEHVDDGRGDEGTTPSEVFRCDGDVRTVRFDDTAVLLRDLKGMRYLERMLADPGREFHVLDLVVAEHGESGRGVPTEDVDVVTRGGDAGPHLDEQARQAYRRRLREIEEDIAEADRTNDLDRRARAESDREFIVTELARATGLGGRDRRAAAAAERARSSVTRTVRYSIDRIEEHHTSLGEHLRRTVRTGLYCAYRPDPLVEVSWDV